jgi:cell division protein FtsB
MKNNFWESKYFILCLVVVLAFALVSLGREAYRYFQVSKEISDLEKRIDDFKKENEELLSLRGIFDSQEFLEDEARKKLNMVKEGEGVIIITDGNNVLPEEPKKQEEKTPNIKLWLKYFFEK